MKKIRAHGIIHVISIIVISIMCVVSVVCSVLCIKKLIENEDVLMSVLLLIGCVGLLTCGIYTISVFLRRKIVLCEDVICIPNNVKKSNFLVRKIQYETIIRYNEIREIYLALRCTDTNNKAIPNCVTPMVNLVVLCQGGIEKVVNLHSYSERQIIYLLDYICEKFKVINGSPLMAMTGKEMLKTFEMNENKKFNRK